MNSHKWKNKPIEENLDASLHRTLNNWVSKQQPPASSRARLLLAASEQSAYKKARSFTMLNWLAGLYAGHQAELQSGGIPSSSFTLVLAFESDMAAIRLVS